MISNYIKMNKELQTVEDFKSMTDKLVRMLRLTKDYDTSSTLDIIRIEGTINAILKAKELVTKDILVPTKEEYNNISLNKNDQLRYIKLIDRILVYCYRELLDGNMIFLCNATSAMVGENSIEKEVIVSLIKEYANSLERDVWWMDDEYSDPDLIRIVVLNAIKFRLMYHFNK